MNDRNIPSKKQFTCYWVEGELHDWDTRTVVVGKLAGEYTGPLVRLDEVMVYLKTLHHETPAFQPRSPKPDNWTLPMALLQAIYEEIRGDDFAPSEEGIEMVLLAYEKLTRRVLHEFPVKTGASQS